MGFRQGKFNTWSRSLKVIPETTLNLKTIKKREPKFYASYDTDGSAPNIYCLLEHSYGRQWILERNALIIKKKAKMKTRVLNDPLEKAKAMAKIKKEKERKNMEEMERILLKFRPGRKKKA